MDKRKGMRRWKTSKWKEHRHMLSKQRKRRHTPKKKQILLPKKKAEGPAWFVRRMERYAIQQAKRNKLSLQEWKLSLIRSGFRNKISSFLLFDRLSPLNIEAIIKKGIRTQGRIEIPTDFSVTANPKESYETLQRMVASLFLEHHHSFVLDYKKCHNVELATQVLQDIILKDFIDFRKWLIRRHRGMLKHFTESFRAEHIYDESVSKMSFSVGSPVNLNIRELSYDDVEKSKLKIHDENSFAKLKRDSSEETELEITSLGEYFINSLAKVGRELTDDAAEDLYDVIGEALVNADEHSTTKYRFSIGYFEKRNIEGREVGLLKMAIMNLGQTIYQKFHDSSDANYKHVTRMKELSEKYTKRRWFNSKIFEEETLWTLYALQDGVTSKQQKRGSGTITIIENFFNMKGSGRKDNVSQMMLVSGSTCINFDGTYEIQKKLDENGNQMSVMTFNDTGNIEDKPDEKFVYCNNSFYPGTLYSITLMLDDNETIKI